MDGVLVYDRSSWRVIHDHLGTINEDSFKAYVRGEIDDLEFMERDIGLWKGIKPDIDISDIEDILGKVKIMKGLERAMGELEREKVRSVIISGGLDILSDRLTDDFGFHLSFANGLETDERGRLTGKGILRVPLRDKVSVLRGIISKNPGISRLVVVGDSPVDTGMFGMADLSIAFRPMEPWISRIADHSIIKDDLSLVSEMILSGD